MEELTNSFLLVFRGIGIPAAPDVGPGNSGANNPDEAGNPNPALIPKEVCARLSVTTRGFSPNEDILCHPRGAVAGELTQVRVMIQAKVDQYCLPRK